MKFLLCSLSDQRSTYPQILSFCTKLGLSHVISKVELWTTLEKRRNVLSIFFTALLPVVMKLHGRLKFEIVELRLL